MLFHSTSFSCFKVRYWGGLSNNNRCTLLKGSRNSVYSYYSIGFKTGCGDYGVDDFPGPNKGVREVYLWMKTNETISTNHFCTNKRNIMSHIGLITQIIATINS